MFKYLFAVCILVNDLDKSLEFYKDILELQVNSTDEGFVDFKLGETSLAIFQKDKAITMFPKSYMNTGGALILAFQVEDIAKSCKRLRSSGVKIFEGPKETSWGQKVAYFQDLDENIWEISQK